MSKQSKRTRDTRTGQFFCIGTKRRRPAITTRETIKVGPTEKKINFAFSLV